MHSKSAPGFDQFDILSKNKAPKYQAKKYSNSSVEWMAYIQTEHLVLIFYFAYFYTP